jgi:TolB protein
MRRTPIAGLGTLLLTATFADAGDLKHPDWHPDGDLLVSEGSCTGNIALYLIDTNTGDIRLLFDSEHVDGYPRWFPDGKRIAFHQIDDQRESRIHIAELSPAREVVEIATVTGGPFDIEPAPSPDGAVLAYSASGQAGQDIALLDLQTNQKTVWETEFPENFPSWHSDGTAILYHANKSGDVQIHQRSLLTGTAFQVSAGPGPNLVGHISADGKQLVFSSERDGDREIYVQQLVDGIVARLTDRPGRDGYPKFSPDSRQIAYHSQLDEGQTVVSVLDLESGESTQFACSDISR